MTRQSHRFLKARARESLAEASYGPKKLFALHLGVTAGIAILLSLLTWLLDAGISSTSGLDSIGTRSLLLTVQQLLSLAYSLASPFWQMGLVFVSILLLRKQPVRPGNLLDGFRKLGPVLRMLILMFLLMFGVSFGSIYVGTILISFTALSSGFMSVMSSIPEDITEAEMMTMMEDPAFMDQMIHGMIPMLIGVFVIMFIVLIPITYRLRMTGFVIMDNPAAGARNAIKTSWKMTKGNCISLFVLDLSFWWYFALSMLLAAVNMAPLFVEIPMDPALLALISTVIFYIGQLALYAIAGPYVQTTQAAAYDLLKAEYEAPKPNELPSQ